MLMRFIVENFACFGDEVTFSMVASKDKRHPKHLIEKTDGAKVKTLRVAGLYGANGHGKTKLVDAIAFLQKFVLEGVKPSADISTQPFRLARDKRQAPTRFEISFHYDLIDYDYGIVMDYKSVREEWLFSRAKTKEILLFSRETTDDGKTSVSFGSSLRRSARDGFLQYVAQGVRPNQAFLTECAERNVDIIKPAYNWFLKILTIVSPIPSQISGFERLLSEPSFVDFTANLLRDSGVGIDRIDAQIIDLEEKIADLSYEKLKDASKHEAHLLGDDDGILGSFQFDEESSKVIAKTINTIRKDDFDEDIRFSLDEESSGTRRMMELSPILFNPGSKELVYVVDELDRKLHPLLSYQIVKSFLEKSPQNTKGQLIFTTHNTHLLDTELLRRDEIWFVEKRPNGSSDLFSLVNFKIRPDLELEKGYLHGRFGAIPLMGNIRALGWDKPKAREIHK